MADVQDTVEEVKAKLIEAAAVYRQDKEVRRSTSPWASATYQAVQATSSGWPVIQYSLLTVQTLDWHVMQDPKDATKFCIVERYEKESSQEYHLNNPVRLPA